MIGLWDHGKGVVPLENDQYDLINENDLNRRANQVIPEVFDSNFGNS